jgi:GNAT superfamily N-acetyltransferase
VSRAQIDSVESIECHALRRDVLRAGDPAAEVSWPEDSIPGAFHLAVRADGAIVAVSSFYPMATPHRPGARAWQLRGMAVQPAQQRRGYGVALLDAAIGRLRAAGAHVLWANARDTALGFYVGYGMHVVGAGFVAAPGLPHHVVVLDLVADPAD